MARLLASVRLRIPGHAVLLHPVQIHELIETSLRWVPIMVHLHLHAFGLLLLMSLLLLLDGLSLRLTRLLRYRLLLRLLRLRRLLLRRRLWRGRRCGRRESVYNLRMVGYRLANRLAPVVRTSHVIAGYGRRMSISSRVKPAARIRDLTSLQSLGKLLGLWVQQREEEARFVPATLDVGELHARHGLDELPVMSRAARRESVLVSPADIVTHA